VRRPSGARMGGAAPLLGTALLAGAVAFWGCDAKPLWRDEVYTASTAGRPLARMAALLATNDAGLSGWYLLVHAWLAVSGATAWLRLLPALAAVAAAVLAAALGGRVAGPGAAWSTGLLVAVLPVLVVHTQEARPYALVAAGLVAVALLALRHLAAPSRGRALAWGAAAVVPALAHPLPALPSLAGIAVGALVAPGRARRSTVVLAALPAGLLGMVPVAVGATQEGVTALDSVTLERLASPWRDLAWGGPVAVLVLVLAAAGATGLGASPSARAVLLGWALVPAATLLLGASAGGYFRIRYFIGAALAVTVLAGLGVDRLRRLPRRRPLLPLVAPAVLAALVGVQGAGALAFRAQPYYGDDPRGAAALLAGRARWCTWGPRPGRWWSATCPTGRGWTTSCWSAGPWPVTPSAAAS
jgi:mannosyltransferase